MPRLIVTPSVLNPSLRRVCEFDGDLETFVRAEYPNVQQWRFQDDGETYYAVGVPGDPITAWYAALAVWQQVLVQVAASFVLSFVANKLIGKPKGPTNRTNDAASPTYNIGQGQNQARLGAVIPVVYGEAVITPDYASQPVVKFIDSTNDQYLIAAFCLGHGDVDVVEAFVGDSSATNLPSDVFQYNVYHPSAHKNVLTAIDYYSLNLGALRVSNTFTNNSVADQVLEGPKDVPGGVAQPAQWHWSIVKNLTGYPDPPPPPGGGPGIRYLSEAELQAYQRPGTGMHEYYLSPLGTRFVVESKTGVAPTGASVEMVGGAIRPNDSTVVDAVAIGPYDMCKPGQRGSKVELDLVFAGGLFTQNASSGALEQRQVSMDAIFTPIDDNGNRNGVDIIKTVSYTAASNTPQRRTFSTTLPTGRYRCAMRRTTLAATDTRTSDQVTWTGLKFELVTSASREPEFGDNYNPDSGIPAPGNYSWKTSNLLGVSQSIVTWDGVRVANIPNETDTQVVVGDWTYHKGASKGLIVGGGGAVAQGYGVYRTPNASTAQTHTAYGDVTIATVRIKATNGLSSGSSSRVRFKCRRNLPILDGAATAPAPNWHWVIFRDDSAFPVAPGATYYSKAELEVMRRPVAVGGPSVLYLSASGKRYTMVTADGPAPAGASDDAVNGAITPRYSGFTYTHNPVDALIDILTAPYGGRRPMTADELDLDEMRRARTKWAAHNGFNGVFDRPTTVWEAMASVLQPVAAVPLPQGSRISIAHDCVKDYRVALFTDENIVAGSMAVSYDFDKIGDPAATRVEYRTPEWFDPAYEVVPPNREDVETVNLFGCTDKTTAYQHGVLANNRRKMRRKSITFETELEGLLVTHGQRIGVTHSTPKWGHSAQVVRVSGRTLTLSVAPDWTLPDLSVLIRDTEGRPHQVRGVTRGANDYELVLPSDPAFTIPTIDGGYEGAVVAIGTYNREVTDWVVMSMEPSGEQRVKITASEYRAEVYTGTMPHQLVDSSVAP